MDPRIETGMTTGETKSAYAQTTEWLTVILILACYGLWAVALFLLPGVSVWLTVSVLAVLIGFHGSLTHEVLHGHPFPSQPLNEATMFLPLSLLIPYNRFRDLHLAHHRDSNLTDPYDDPETSYLDPHVWQRLPWWVQAVLGVNNTLLGRILIGAGIGQILFFRNEWRGAKAGDRAIWLAWALHMAGATIVLWLVAMSPTPVWAYLVAAYAGLSILKIRTFLEHRAHEKTRARTVIIEDRGPLAFMFLNNNLHVVHHMNPGASWYRLPAIYGAAKDRYQQVNDAYVYRSYAEIFRCYFLHAKDPVPHPLWPKP